MVRASYGMRLVAGQDLAPASILAIKALAEPQTLSRITGMLAQFGIIPATLSSQRAGDYLLIDVQFYAGETTRADIVLAKIQAMVAVQRANVVDR